MMSDQNKTISVKCSRCGGKERNHKIIYSHDERDDSPDGEISVWLHYKIVKCLGCNKVRFRESYYCSEDVDPETGVPEELGIRIYQAEGDNKYQATIPAEIPEEIRRIYSETVKCFNAGANTLAGGGLRATVEVICKEQGVTGDDLEKKINALVEKGALAKKQADLLHEERYIGNEALHEMRLPKDQDIIDGLAIIEGMMRTIYVLPIHASRLKRVRENEKSDSIKKGKGH